MDTYGKIKKLCDDRGITLGTVAKETDIRNSVFTELKMGRTKQLSVPTLEKLASFFEVPVSFFIGDETENENDETAQKRKLIYEMTETVGESELDSLLEILRSMQKGNQNAE